MILNIWRCEMDTKRKIIENGTIYFNPDQLGWIGVELGDMVIVRDDEGKHGRFISIFKPGEE